MPPCNYQKREIINPDRICELKCCSTPFMATRQDQRFHSHKCAEKQWRIDHPRKTHYIHSSFKNNEICCAKDVKRDNPEKLAKYLESNPFYAADFLRGKSVDQYVKSIFS
jgi:hypothetical protein